MPEFKYSHSISLIAITLHWFSVPASLSTGKSALHWAAAVNNVDAAVVLLKNGANKDLQNNKVFICVEWWILG